MQMRPAAGAASRATVKQCHAFATMMMEPIPPVTVGTSNTDGGSQSTEDFHRKVLNAIRDHAIFTLNQEGAIVTWGAGAERLTGYAPEEVLGKSYSMFSAQASEADLHRMLQVAQNEGCFQQERWWRR